MPADAARLDALVSRLTARMPVVLAARPAACHGPNAARGGIFAHLDRG